MQRRLAGWGLVAAAVAVAAVYYRFNPATTYFFPKCVFYQATGLYCAGCGGQRALHQLLHGNFREAFYNNALLLLAIPYLCLGFVLDLARGYRYDPNAWFWPRWGVGLLVAGLIFWIVRNLPGEPFSLLRPLP